MKNYEEHSISFYFNGQIVGSIWAASYSIDEDGHILFYDSKYHLVGSSYKPFIYPGDLEKIIKECYFYDN